MLSRISLKKNRTLKLSQKVNSSFFLLGMLLLGM